MPVFDILTVYATSNLYNTSIILNNDLNRTFNFTSVFFFVSINFATCITKIGFFVFSSVYNNVSVHNHLNLIHIVSRILYIQVCTPKHPIIYVLSIIIRLYEYKWHEKISLLIQSRP